MATSPNCLWVYSFMKWWGIIWLLNRTTQMKTSRKRKFGNLQINKKKTLRFKGDCMQAVVVCRTSKRRESWSDLSIRKRQRWMSESYSYKSDQYKTYITGTNVSFYCATLSRHGLYLSRDHRVLLRNKSWHPYYTRAVRLKK